MDKIDWNYCWRVLREDWDSNGLTPEVKNVLAKILNELYDINQKLPSRDNGK